MDRHEDGIIVIPAWDKKTGQTLLKLEKDRRGRRGRFDFIMSDLTENPLSAFDSYDDYLVIHKPLIIEKLMELTNTDPRMNESQRSGFYKCYHDLVPQEPTLEEMDLAFNSYVAHFDHIPCPLLLLNTSTDLELAYCQTKKVSLLNRSKNQKAVSRWKLGSRRWKKMNKTILSEAIEFMQEIDAWHEFKYSDRQIQLVAPEISAFSKIAHSEAFKL